MRTARKVLALLLCVRASFVHKWISPRKLWESANRIVAGPLPSGIPVPLDFMLPRSDTTSKDVRRGLLMRCIRFISRALSWAESYFGGRDVLEYSFCVSYADRVCVLPKRICAGIGFRIRSHSLTVPDLAYLWLWNGMQGPCR